MSNEEAKREAKTHLEELLQQMGVDTNRNFRCLNPGHEDRNPSMSFDRRSMKAHCFTCGASYDVFDVLGLEHGYTDRDGLQNGKFPEMMREACERFGIAYGQENPSPKGSETPKPIKKNAAAKEAQTDGKDAVKAEKARRQVQEARKRLESPEAVEYLRKRGISLQTARAHGLGYLPSFYTSEGAWRALIVPTSETSFLARNIDVDESGKKSAKRGHARPFNLEAVYDAETVHLCEGEIDALSVCEVGGAAIGMGSASYARRFIEELGNVLATPSRPLKMKTLILSLDNDEAGLRAAQNVREGINELKERGIADLTVKTIDIAQGFKDPNEALCADREAFAKAVAKRVTDAEAAAYAETSAKTRLLAFYNGVQESASTEPVPTGFSLLDGKLDGGLREGLVILPAVTSLGKTTFALQVMENAAKCGQDVLYVSLEMSAEELIAKSLSRHTFLIAARDRMDLANVKTVRGITDGKRYEKYSEAEMKLIMKAYEAYNEYAEHVFIKEGLGDISAKDVRAMVQKHRDVTGNTPIVFIDYIQILQPMDMRATDKQAMDATVLELKKVSRDYKTPVVVLSSLNRSNYDGPINLAALKESGALEYSADIVLGLQLQGAESREARNDKSWVDRRMQEDPRHIEMKVLKNRNGERGASLYYDYFPMFNCFQEADRPAITYRDEEE